jgi:hypothetical protein
MYRHRLAPGVQLQFLVFLKAGYPFCQVQN